MNSRTILVAATVLGVCVGIEAVMAAGQAPAATSGKKVYISADIEGISGVTGDEQTSGAGSDYARGRRLMTEDVNAAIRGAFEGGATDVLVSDSHGSMRNILPEDLNLAARLITHTFRPYGMMQGLDETFDAVIFVGYHAKAGSPVGGFAHTGSSTVIADVQINGKSVGEGGMNTLYAAWYGVPVVMVTGDDVAVAQVKEGAPDAVGVVVKTAINTRGVELRPLAAARRDIQDAARKVVAGARKIPPQRSGPFRWVVRFRATLIPDVAEAIPTIQRTAPDTLAFSSDSFPASFRLFRVLYRYVNPD